MRLVGVKHPLHRQRIVTSPAEAPLSNAIPHDVARSIAAGVRQT